MEKTGFLDVKQRKSAGLELEDEANRPFLAGDGTSHSARRGAEEVTREGL